MKNWCYTSRVGHEGERERCLNVWWWCQWINLWANRQFGVSFVTSFQLEIEFELFSSVSHSVFAIFHLFTLSPVFFRDVFELHDTTLDLTPHFTERRYRFIVMLLHSSMTTNWLSMI